jgi:hypothetical protein
VQSNRGRAVLRSKTDRRGSDESIGLETGVEARQSVNGAPGLVIKSRGSRRLHSESNSDVGQRQRSREEQEKRGRQEEIIGTTGGQNLLSITNEWLGREWHTGGSG